MMPVPNSEENVLNPDPYLVVTRTQIYFGEELSILQLVKKVINSGEMVLVLDRNSVQSPVVNTQS